MCLWGDVFRWPQSLPPGSQSLGPLTCPSGFILKAGTQSNKAHGEEGGGKRIKLTSLAVLSTSSVFPGPFKSSVILNPFKFTPRKEKEIIVPSLVLPN